MTLLVVDDDAAMRHLLKGGLEGESSVALHLGATRYLEKPFRVAELLTAVRMVTKGVKPEPVLDTRVNAPRAVTREGHRLAFLAGGPRHPGCAKGDLSANSGERTRRER